MKEVEIINQKMNEFFSQLYPLSSPVMLGKSFDQIEILNPTIFEILIYLKMCVYEINTTTDKSICWSNWRQYRNHLYQNFIHYNYEKRIDIAKKKKFAKIIHAIESKLLNDKVKEEGIGFNNFHEQNFGEFFNKIKQIKTEWGDKMQAILIINNNMN